LQKGLFVVPGKPQPAHPLEDEAGVLVGGAGLVSVFDAQEELSAGPARIKPVVESGARPSDVEVAGGAGSEARADLRHGADRLAQSSYLMNRLITAFTLPVVSSLIGLRRSPTRHCAG